LQEKRRAAARLASVALCVCGALGAGCAGWPLPASATPEVYLVDPQHTFPQFEISHLGFSRHRGRFNDTRGRIEIDREARQGSIEISIAAASIDTGDEKLETVLKSDAFFDVTRHPTLVFRSTRLHFEDDRPVAVDGELTLLGTTRPLRLTLDHFHCGLVLIGLRWVCGANATTTLRRSEFGMDRFLALGLGDEVRITIQIEAQREPAPAPPVTP
jgi:polyisoprenoid-binding protein YceI